MLRMRQSGTVASTKQEQSRDKTGSGVCSYYVCPPKIILANWEMYLDLMHPDQRILGIWWGYKWCKGWQICGTGLSHVFFCFVFLFLVSPLIWKLRHFFFATVSFGPVLGWGQFSARARPRHARHVKCSEWLTYDMVLICGDMILFRYKVFEVSQATSSTIIPQHPGLDLCDALKRHYRVHTHCCSSSDISSKVAGKYLQEAKPQIKNLPK